MTERLSMEAMRYATKRGDEAAFTNWLGDPLTFANPVNLEELDQYHDAYKKIDSNHRCKHLAGMIAFCYTAEYATESKDKSKDKSKEWYHPTFWLGREGFCAYLCQFYEIRAAGEASLEFEWLAQGLTSYILRSGSSGDRVLKILKPWYKDNPTSTSSIKSYVNALKGMGGEEKRAAENPLNYVPHLFRYGSAWIEMEHIQGPTLRQYWENNLSKLNGNKRLSEIRAITTVLCNALEQCAHTHYGSHGDLSPHNIIVEKGNPQTLKLIDLGDNYLSIEQRGSYRNLVDHLNYIAPEVFQHGQNSGIPMTGSRQFKGITPSQVHGYTAIPTGVLRDVYSLGVIIVELLGRPLPSQSPRRLTTPHEAIHALYLDESYSGQGALLDVLAMLIDSDDQRRSWSIAIDAKPVLVVTKLGQAAPDWPWEYYAGLQSRFEAAYESSIDVTADISRSERASAWARLPTTYDISVLFNRTVGSFRDKHASWLALSSISFAFGLFHLLTAFFSTPAFQAQVISINLLGWTLRVEPLQQEMQSIIIGATLLFMAFLYYIRLLGDIDIHFHANRPERFLRGGAILCGRSLVFAPALVSIAVVDWQLSWPIVSAIGWGIIAVTTWFYYGIVKWTEKEMRSTSSTTSRNSMNKYRPVELSVTSGLRPALAVFASWRLTMVLYGIFMAILGIMSLPGVVAPQYQPSLGYFFVIVLLVNLEGLERSLVRQAKMVHDMVFQLMRWHNRIIHQEHCEKKALDLGAMLQKPSWRKDQIPMDDNRNYELEYDKKEKLHRLYLNSDNCGYAYELFHKRLINWGVEIEWLPIEFVLR